MNNPYAYEVVPPIGRLLDAICAHCGVGGTIRPRNRTLADWAGYRSAGHVGELLDQLACDGRILYDRTTGLITRLFDPERDQLIPSGITSEDAEEADDSALIPSRDRVLGQQDAENESIPRRDQNAPRMEDHVLVTTTRDSESVVVNKIKIPCAADLIPPMDHPTRLLLSELLPPPGRGVIERVLAKRDWTPQQIRDRYEYDKPRIENSGGKNTWGIFWTALMAGELAPARADPDRPIDVAAYADDPGYALGGDSGPPGEAQQRAEAYTDAHWRAVDLLGKGAPFRDMAIVVEALVNGGSDVQALAALEEHRSAVRP